MKKTLILVMFMNLGVTLSSCENDCFLLALFSWFYAPDSPEIEYFELECYDIADLLEGVGNAAFGKSNFTATGRSGLHAEESKVPPPGGNEIPDNLPSDETDGDRREEATGSTFKDIITSPTFALGPSLSWLGGDKEESEKFPAKPGFQLGAIWQVPLTAGLNLEPGLLYASRGVGYKSEEAGYYQPGTPGGSYSYSQRKKLHYLELPAFVSGSIMNGLDLYGGPQVAFLLGAKVVNESNGETTSTEKGTKGFNKVDLGLAAGARYQIPNTFFSLSLGYYHGLSNLSSGSEYGGYGYDEPKYFTRAARLGINYNFPAARSHATSGSAAKNGFKSWVAK